MAILFAATYPERTRALVLYGAYAKRLDPDDDYPWAPTHEARADYIERLERDWGFESDMKMMCPSADEAMAQWWGARCRAAASPGAIRSLNEMNSLIDVRDLLPAIRVPTLVVHRGTDYDVKVEEGRYVAARIPGARFVELPGADHFVAVDPDQILDVVEPFLADCGASPAPPVDDRVLATLLAVDVVDATGMAAHHGEPGWRDLAGRLHDLVDAELARYRGREVDAAGDGVLAVFDGPARAIRCACAVVQSAQRLGLELRAGVHTGEVELSGTTIRGIAVDVAARVAAEAAPGEVLVSRTVRDLVAGSKIAFSDRGSHVLAGIADELQLLAVEDRVPAPARD
jgi:class 3 adenylate cyclase